MPNSVAREASDRLRTASVYIYIDGITVEIVVEVLQLWLVILVEVVHIVVYIGVGELVLVNIVEIEGVIVLVIVSLFELQLLVNTTTFEVCEVTVAALVIIPSQPRFLSFLLFQKAQGSGLAFEVSVAHLVEGEWSAS
jgi:hypothetical protein